MNATAVTRSASRPTRRAGLTAPQMRQHSLAIFFMLGSNTLGAGLACSQEAPSAENTGAKSSVAENTEPVNPPSPWTYSLGTKLDIGDLRQFNGLELRPTLGLRYGRWRVGAVDSQTWPQFGQALQDSNLTYDWMKDSQWQTALSASVLNLDQDATFDAFKAGRKTLRVSASLNYSLNRRWILGMNMTQDLLKRGDGTTLSPTLTYRKTLDKDSALLLSAYTTWATASHWQTDAARTEGSALRQTAGLGIWGAQITYRQRWSPKWAFYSQVSTSRLISPATPVRGPQGFAGQLGVIYFSH
ncbi:hypothetical protein [Limnohabitans sp. 2KL-17]|uniref:hypothetical protein n=1 Tax=Limnohabitans sp. 2KL-17 TaxID=1100704 RepID=UPI001304852E|nr:hypothetical protein [Limnohabitans sp. 2KL-17]